MSRKAVVRIVGLLMLLALPLGYLRWAQRIPVSNDADEVFEIQKGESLRQISSELQRRGIVGYAPLFIALAYWRGDAGRLKFGEYLVRPRISLADLIDQFASGRVRQHAFAIIEGWDVRQLLRALADQPALDHRLSGTRPEEIMLALGLGEGSAEGRFFPDTYFYPKGFVDAALLRRAYERMQLLLEVEWQRRQAGLPYANAYQALVMASIIEKETARREERAQIAGVFVRRLQHGMRLQTDPTVIYGMADSYAGNISHEDLRKDTPYNTYTRKGLPPTPIAMPGAASLHAALHPDQGDSLYFVARGDGSHVFSSNLADHQRAVTEFQRKGRD